MPSTFDELLERASSSQEPQIPIKIGIRPGGVDPLGLRQINFGLMSRVLPDLNNVARHIRPYVVMAWGWRRIGRVLQRDDKLGALDSELRDFVDRIEALYAWSQFLIDANADLPGAVAMRHLIDAESYVFGGEDWQRRRDVRRYSTGLISPLNYGPSLQSMEWLVKSTEGVGVFSVPTELDPVLDAFEQQFSGELDHPAFNRLGPVEVRREHVEKWGKLWSMHQPLAIEREALFERLGGKRSIASRQQGISLIRTGFADLSDPDCEPEQIRARMADLPDAWDNPDACPPMAAEWRRVQVRQVFRLTLEGLLFWFIGQLGEGPMHSVAAANAFIDELGTARLPKTAGAWLLDKGVDENPVGVLAKLREALRYRKGLASAVVKGLRHCLYEAPAEAFDFEPFDRLPLARARKEANEWRDHSPRDFFIRVLETWIMAQHTYWCVNRGLSDARGRGKTILRLRIVMDEGGWTQTPGTTLGNPPEATPDRLGTAISLLEECGRLKRSKV